ncbi:MAG: hypothetical protein R2712_06560 [Vicinamibacterales bacterium]
MLRLLARPVPVLVRALVLTASALAAACGSDSTTTPTTPTPDPITETFSGTLTVNGASTHTFSSSASGSVSATVNTIAPDTSTMMGISLGIWNGTGCNIVVANDEAVQTTVVYGNATSAGQLCVRLYDVGRFSEPTSYEITVVHP